MHVWLSDLLKLVIFLDHTCSWCSGVSCAPVISSYLLIFISRLYFIDSIVFIFVKLLDI